MQFENNIEVPKFMINFEWLRSSSGHKVSSTPLIADHDFNQSIGLAKHAMVYQENPELKTPPFIFSCIPHSSEKLIRVPQDILFPRPDTLIMDNQLLPSLVMAQSPPTIDALILFSNQFGLLTRGLLLNIDGKPYFGDSVRLWFENRWIIKNLLTLWELISKKDIIHLKRLFIRMNIDNVHRFIMTDNDIINELHYTNGYALQKKTDLQLQISQTNNIGIHQLFLEQPYFVQNPTFSDNEIIRIAYEYLLIQLRNRLEYFPTQFDVMYNPNINKLEQGFKTDTLIGLIWYQFFHYVTGERKLKRCIYCGQWQDVTSRKDNWKAHKLCSGKERKKNWRNARKPTGKTRGRPKKENQSIEGGFS